MTIKLYSYLITRFNNKVKSYSFPFQIQILLCRMYEAMVVALMHTELFKKLTSKNKNLQ